MLIERAPPADEALQQAPAVGAAAVHVLAGDAVAALQLPRVAALQQQRRRAALCGAHLCGVCNPRIDVVGKVTSSIETLTLGR